MFFSCRTMIGLELLEVTTGVVDSPIGALEPTRPVPMTGAFPTPRKSGTREVPAPERTGTNGKMTSGPRVGEAKMRNGTSGRIL